MIYSCLPKHVSFVPKIETLDGLIFKGNNNE